MAQTQARKQRQQAFQLRRKLLSEVAVLLFGAQRATLSKEQRHLFERCFEARTEQDLMALKEQLRERALYPRLAKRRPFIKYVGLRQARPGETVIVYGGHAAGHRYVSRLALGDGRREFVPRGEPKVVTPLDELRAMLAPADYQYLDAHGLLRRLVRRQRAGV